MTDAAKSAYAVRLKRRYASEKRFRFYGVAALAITTAFLAYLLIDIVIKGWPAFFEHRAVISVTVPADKVDAAKIAEADFTGLVRDAFRDKFPGDDVTC